MCGIAGIVDWAKRPDARTAESMADSMAHRGPDAFGIAEYGNAVLAHRRLSIIDTSDAGKQPMTDATGRYSIVFNGEIYNYQELKTELLALGSGFRTKTDTEVILAAYAAWGKDAIKRFNGMFAFAIWDAKENTLLLVRDRLGKKPLYYHYRDDCSVSFASELKALLRDNAINRKIDPAAVSHFLSLNYTLTGHCMIDGVQKMKPGHYTEFSRNGKSAEIPYWDLASAFNKKARFNSIDDAAEELRALIDDSVKLRMISDVPLGAFLSGGIDSSSIAASMCKAATAGKPKTFSIGFREKSYSEMDEAAYAASELGIAHKGKTVDANMAAVFPEIVIAADEPFADSSMIPTYYLSQFTRENVTVALSGDGGDEIFAGYVTYSADKIHHFISRLPAFSLFPMRLLAGRLPVSFDKVSLDYKLRQFLKGHALSADNAHYSWREIFDAGEKERLMTKQFNPGITETNPSRVFSGFASEVGDCHYIDRASYVDIKTFLVDDILVKVDRMTMAHSLEARAPFLDYRIVEFAASLPVNYKLKGFDKKYILKKSQEHILPRRILYRKKMGFNAPVSHWLETSMKDFVDKMIEDKAGVFQGMLNHDEIQKIFDAHKNRQQDNGLKLLGLLSLYMWMENYL